MTVGAISGVVSTLLFNHLALRYFGPRAIYGSIWFAAGTVCNLIVGRITFACGLAFALAAVVALAHRAVPLGAIFAAATSLTSPVAGVGALLAVCAWALSRRENRRAGVAVGLCAGLPLAAISLEHEQREHAKDRVAEVGEEFPAGVGARSRDLGLYVSLDGAVDLGDEP